jgi:four helix bundle protein
MRVAELARELAAPIRKRDPNLANQLLKAAVSVPANIAEGYGRSARGEYLHFLAIAAGSLTETETHVLIAKSARLAPDHLTESLLSAADEAGRVLMGLRKSLAPDMKKAPRWPSPRTP